MTALIIANYSAKSSDKIILVTFFQMSIEMLQYDNVYCNFETQ